MFSKFYFSENSIVLDSYLEAIAGLGFLADYIEDGVDELGSLSVVTLIYQLNYLRFENISILHVFVFLTFGPVVSGSRLSENEVVWAENLSEGSRSDRVHGSGLQVDKDGTGDIFASSSLIVVDINALELKVGVSVVGSGGVDSVFVRDNFPELKIK